MFILSKCFGLGHYFESSSFLRSNRNFSKNTSMPVSLRDASLGIKICYTGTGNFFPCCHGGENRTLIEKESPKFTNNAVIYIGLEN